MLPLRIAYRPITVSKKCKEDPESLVCSVTNEGGYWLLYDYQNCKSHPLRFMESKASLSCSQKHTTDPYHEPKNAI
jgi:hypothetical protein